MIRVCEDNVFTLYFQGKYYGSIHVEDPIPEQKGVGNFHVHMVKFSHNILNRMRRDEESLMSYIRDAGYNELISFVDVNHVKHGDLRLWTKFVKLFGFEEPKLYTRRVI